MADKSILTPVKAGSYVQAATLASTFAKASIKTPLDEIKAVSEVFRKAVEFVDEITPALLNNLVVVATEPKPVIGSESRRLLDIEIMRKKAKETQPGDGLSFDAFIQTSDSTNLKLEKIADNLSISGTPGMPAKTLAARMVLSAYADLQAAISESPYNSVYLTRVKENRIDDSFPKKNLARFKITKK